MEISSQFSSVLLRSTSLRFVRKPTYRPKPEDISKRGSIRTFSAHSALRLREALSKARVPKSKTVGITLTVPWPVENLAIDAALDEYQVCFNRFLVSFKRLFPNSAGIFRHELQERRMPHCHIVFWLSNFDADISNFDFDVFRSAVQSLWLRSVKDIHGGDLEGFFRFGVKVDHVDGQIAIYRYLCDHCSKKKQAQLGYKGKQWGYIHRALFVADFDVRVDMSPRTLQLVSRQISRYCRYTERPDNHCKDSKRNRRIKSLFGYKKLSRRRLNGVVFVRRSMAERLIDYYSTLSGSPVVYHLLYDLPLDLFLCYLQFLIDSPDSIVCNITFPAWFFGHGWFGF